MMKEISKEAVNLLPLWTFDGPITLLQEPDAFQQAAERLAAAEFIGIDTETRPTFSKGARHDPALLQLALDDVVYLVRLFQVGLPRPIAGLLEDPGVAKIGIAPGDDLRDLRRVYGLEARNVVDLNGWCKQRGFQSVGARKLAALVLGKRISKRQQVSNWEAPRLSPAQLSYAATDAWICQAIYRKLRG